MLKFLLLLVLALPCWAASSEKIATEPLVVMVVRYMHIDTGKILGATVSFAQNNNLPWTQKSCEQRKLELDPQPDPPGTKAFIDCVHPSYIQRLLTPDHTT